MTQPVFSALTVFPVIMLNNASNFALMGIEDLYRFVEINRCLICSYKWRILSCTKWFPHLRFK